MRPPVVVRGYDNRGPEDGGGRGGAPAGERERTAALLGRRAAPTNSTATSIGPTRRATSATTPIDALSPLTYTVGTPSAASTKPVTSQLT
jgi:hypothetical protein